MPKYKFEIQNCISVEIDAETKEDARTKIIENLDSYSEDMIEDCYVSDGTEMNED